MTPFRTAVLSGSHKLVPRNGVEFEGEIIVYVCVRER